MLVTPLGTIVPYDDPLQVHVRDLAGLLPQSRHLVIGQVEVGLQVPGGEATVQVLVSKIQVKVWFKVPEGLATVLVLSTVQYNSRLCMITAYPSFWLLTN